MKSPKIVSWQFAMIEISEKDEAEKGISTHIHSLSSSGQTTQSTDSAVKKSSTLIGE